jgi:ABC-type nitrate/sulfonate/bicarbonate transport system permease component
VSAPDITIARDAQLPSIAGPRLRGTAVAGALGAVSQRVLGAFALIVLWWLASTQFSAAQLPRPELVWAQLTQNLTSDPALSFTGVDGGYLGNLWYTVHTAIVASLGGGAIGFAVGIGSARSQLVRDVSAPLLILFGTVPSLVAAPFMLIWFGTGQLAQSVIVGFFCFVVMGITAQNAAQAIPRAYEEMAATLGATQRQRLWKIVVPGSAPALIAAVRVCLVTGWSLQVASELLGGSRGVGKVVSASEQLGNTAGALAIIILLAAVGLTIETVASVLLRYVTRWNAGNRS